MRILKKVLIGFVVVLLLPFIIAIFVSKEYSVEKEIIIKKPKLEIFNFIKYLKNGNKYSVWNQMDPNRKEEFKGEEDGSVGAIHYWNSENDNVGEGEQEIKNIIEGDRIDVELRFIRPFEAKDNAYMITESISENTTKVKWGFNGRMDYPMNFILLFMNFEDMLGEQLQQGLVNLKELLENQDSTNEDTITTEKED